MNNPSKIAKAKPIPNVCESRFCLKVLGAVVTPDISDPTVKIIMDGLPPGAAGPYAPAAPGAATPPCTYPVSAR